MLGPDCHCQVAEVAEREDFGIVKTLVGHGIGEFFHGVPQALTGGSVLRPLVGDRCHFGGVSPRFQTQKVEDLIRALGICTVT